MQADPKSLSCRAEGPEPRRDLGFGIEHETAARAVGAGQHDKPRQPVLAQPVIGLGSMAATAPAGVVTDHGTSPMRQPRKGQVLPVVLVAFIGKAMPCHAQRAPRCPRPQQPAEASRNRRDRRRSEPACRLCAAIFCAAACPVPGPLPEACYLAPHAKRAAAAALPSCVSSDFGPRQQSVGQGALSFPDGSAGRRRGGGSRHR